MKYLIPVVVLVALVFATGCAKNKKSASQSVNGSVTDINVAPVPPSEPDIAYSATPDYQTTPAYYAPPVAAASAPVASTAGGVSPGTSYTIRRGDTLYGIARQAYGDGKQWQRIAAANPGVSPSSLQVGQAVMIP